MQSSQPDAESSGSSSGHRDSSALIDLKILSPSPEVRDGLAFTSLSTSTTVGQLKEKVREVLPSRPANDRQRLIYRGRVLADEAQTLSYVFGEDAVKQQKEHTLHLVIPDNNAHLGNAPHPNPNASHRQNQTPTNPFQNHLHPNQPQTAVPIANPFRSIMAGQRPASVPPTHRMPSMNTPVPPVPPIPGLHQHMVHMQAMQQQMQQLQQRAAAAGGAPQNNAQRPEHQAQFDGHGQPADQQSRVGHGQGHGQAIHQTQPNGQPGQTPQNGPSLPAIGTPSQTPSLPGGANNFTRSGVGPHGESWTVTVNTTTAMPQAAHMQAQMPGQTPFMPSFPHPFGQMPGQNLQFGPLPPMGLPHPPTVQFPHIPRAPGVEAQMADLERFVQEQQQRVQNFNPSPLDPTARAEGDRIRNDLQDAMTQLHSLRVLASNGIASLNATVGRDPGPPQTLIDNSQTVTPNRTGSHNGLPLRQQNGTSAQNSLNPQNHTVTNETPSAAPIVYLLSSPTGPEALLLSPSGTFTSSGALHQLLPLQQNDFYQPRMRSLYPNMPQQPVGGARSRVRNALNNQGFMGNLPNQASNVSQPDQTHAVHQHQQTSGNQSQPLDQNQPGGPAQQQPPQAPRNPFLPDQQPRNAVAPGQAAQVLNAQNVPAAQDQLNIGAIAGHLWVMVRILGFLWLFFGGSNVGYVRPFIIGVVAFLAYAAQQQGPIRRLGERVREHVEGLLRPREEVERHRQEQRGQGQGQGEEQVPPSSGPNGEAPSRNAVAGGSNVPRAHREPQRAWIRAQMLNAERAVALFVASLWPGVGERHVQARERERRQREEDEARQRREQEERERLRREEEAAKATAEEEARRESEATVETVGLRSPPAPGQEEGLRERRPALVQDGQDASAENGSAEKKHKGKEAVRGEDVAEGGTTADPTSWGLGGNSND